MVVLQYCTEHGGIHYNNVQNMMVYIKILYRTWWYTLQYCTEHGGIHYNTVQNMVVYITILYIT